MKRNLAAGLLITVILVGVAAAVGGSASDPLISLRYLEDTYIPQTAQKLQDCAAAGTDQTYSAAVARLDKLVANALGEAGTGDTGDNMNHSANFTPIHMKRGDSIDLTAGSGIALSAGRCNVAAGTFLDLTDGIECVPGTALKEGHRYLVVGNNIATISIISDSARLSIQGGYRQRISNIVTTPFTDIGSVDWFYGAVRYCYQGGLFLGTGPEVFTPQGEVTRAMLATVLYRLAGEPVGGTHSFTDVPADEWYSNPVAWAAGNHIVNGVEPNLYNPNGLVTREQMAAMLYRYAGEYLKQDVSKTAALSSFKDGNKTAQWARSAMSWAVGTELVTGKDGGILDPGGTAKRAEVATMLQRFSILISVG
ncbi:MAG: S-layer homology domain-containing protein [Oscillospiraceae bacterium]